MPTKLVNATKVNEVFAHLNESADNHALYSALSRGDEIEIKGMTLSPGYRIVRVDGRLSDKVDQSHFELALINDVSEDVAYYNRIVIQPDSFLNCRPVTQILVWRTQKPKHRKELHDLAGVIFLEYLLEKYDVIVSDMNQTHDGMSFWQARMYDALAYGMKVYAYDMISCVINEIKSDDDVGRYEQWLWGDPEHYQNRLAIISKLELPAK
ncbi:MULTISPECIES: hypothetical protein [Lonsdalea]|uniref:Uncharacterized protein n=2 Tax=Lonsdalea TaxID=1082702 RepID=A0ACD1JGN5_9GAMM|nr:MULTISPECIES: hypothetical protein [Lonsdalea]RAT16176.1 hypothetical protein AU485_01820 [Lonsdalea quercina]RAT23905.1 hypothetical protein AU487_00735 [Lonsdalea populi]RAT25426.1 hypothetical protein AU489_06920 [Lonsdalea populi]RAT28518.1 hypothetical protein AU488_00640 [Lonsdalea populi]RAT38324.1 hypothetical protein AU492_00680 [Lonsdalea populi]